MKKNENDRVKLPTQKRSDWVAEDLKRVIISENMRIGDRLPNEKQLTDIYQTSRWTIRESLKSLEVQGLIELNPGPKGGASLCPVPYERAFQLLCNYFHYEDLTVDQICEMRVMLEPILAETVTGLLREDDFTALEQTIETCRHGVESSAERMTFRRSEIEFHNILARICPNIFLGFICRILNDLLSHLVVYKNVSPEDSLKQSQAILDHHVKILKALRKQDKARVRETMTKHMHTNIQFVSKFETAVQQGLIIRDFDL